MLSRPLYDTMQDLGLRGMARAFERQHGQPTTADLGFDERFALLLDAERLERANYRYAQRLRWAKLPQQNACLEDLDHRTPRGLDKRVVAQLSDLRWVDQHLNVLIVGPTGVGKSYLASALAHHACKHEIGVRCLRLPRLIEEFAKADALRKKSALFRQLAKVPLLVLDDFGLTPLADTHQRDLLELLDDRYDKAATLVTSQLPIDGWHAYLGDPTLADAILDRLVHNAYRIVLKGESMRARRAHPATDPSPPKEAAAKTD
ncbi:MAG: IS21-like element helper ATPase IstB [Hydrogenophaga sp.]|uniref:IS21-like element helper ATPase IstB n=1 Tax=Hydrogenophaga sp. TaxID=1904254 RepID=UPI002AB8C1A0|nr:IS21-like element helper ATPase IstB [Hydrogenophaga sp.]MDZ4283892.1 IS21-like element helper ATPase IstB [Hydrogenophaga sp.]